MEIEELEELVKGINRRCLVVFLLIDNQRIELLPTILEDIYVDSQLIVMDYCVKDERKGNPGTSL